LRRLPPMMLSEDRRYTNSLVNPDQFRFVCVNRPGSFVELAKVPVAGANGSYVAVNPV
jgi:hypothetical protein